MHDEEEEEIVNLPKNTEASAGRKLGNMFRNVAAPKQKVKIPKFFRSFYFIVGSIFLIWMLFFDINDLYTQYQRREKMKQLQKDKVFYAKGIQKIKDERAKLSTDPKKLEKFAREKYYMKKRGEDVYVIVEEKDKEEVVEAVITTPKNNTKLAPVPKKEQTTSADSSKN